MISKETKLFRFYYSSILHHMYDALLKNGAKEAADRIDLRKRQLNGLVIQLTHYKKLSEKDWAMFDRMYEPSIIQAEHLSEELENRAKWAKENPEYAKLEQVPVDIKYCLIAANQLARDVDKLRKENSYGF